MKRDEVDGLNAPDVGALGVCSPADVSVVVGFGVKRDLAAAPDSAGLSSAASNNFAVLLAPAGSFGYSTVSFDFLRLNSV